VVALPESTVTADYLKGWPHVRPKTARGFIENTATLLRAIKEYRPDVIHSFSRLGYLLPVLLTKIPKVMSYQLSVRGYHVGVAASTARSLIFTGCSEFVANMGRKRGGNWYVVPNFVDTERYDWTVDVSADAPLIFLSRVGSDKGAHVAVEVAKRTGRRLLIAGNHADSGPERSYWDNLIAPELGQNGIEHVGPVDDSAKCALLSSASALIVPIQWDEPFGIVFAEALACGTPVISCPRGALPEIIRNGVEGFLVNSVSEACDAVTKIQQIDRAACRRRAVNEFSSAVAVRRYESIYETFSSVQER
jgi:glycosyltransferase involved in cell wall biosynthesis